MGYIIFDHYFKAYWQWGAVSAIVDRFDQFGDYNHLVVVQHLSYFQRHDGHQLDDVIDQCIFAAQNSSLKLNFMMLMKLNLKPFMLINFLTHLILLPK
jgi:hypothetical protein